MDSILGEVLAELTCSVRGVSIESLKMTGALMESSDRIFVAGAGRSGLCMRALGMRLMHLGKIVYVVGETTTPGISAGNLLILASGSGQTASLLSVANQARRQGAKILLFSTDPNSPMARLADRMVIIPAPSLHSMDGASGGKSVQPMGSLYEQSLLVLCDSLVLWLMQRGRIDVAEMAERHANLE